MATYEVTYSEGEEVQSVLVEAASPVEATRLFQEKHAGEGKVVLCVVLQ